MANDNGRYLQVGALITSSEQTVVSPLRRLKHTWPLTSCMIYVHVTGFALPSPLALDLHATCPSFHTPNSSRSRGLEPQHPEIPWDPFPKIPKAAVLQHLRPDIVTTCHNSQLLPVPHPARFGIAKSLSSRPCRFLSPCHPCHACTASSCLPVFWVYWPC